MRAERYRVVGSEVAMYVLGYVEVKVVAENGESEWVRARAVSVPGEWEVLIGDDLIEEVGIEVAKPKSSLWRFTGEERLRRSEEAEYWIERLRLITGDLHGEFQH